MRAATIRECCVNKCPSLTSSDAFKASLAIATTARLFASVENRARGAFDVIAVHFCCDSNISPINIGKFFFTSRSLKTLFLVSESFFNPLRTVDRFRFVILFVLIYNIYICKGSIKIVNFLSKKEIEIFYSFSRLIIDSGNFIFDILIRGSLDTPDKIGWLSDRDIVCKK